MAPHAEHGSDPKIDALVAEITAARAELLASVDDLKEQFSPASLRQRSLGAITGIFTDQFGGIKPKRVAITAGVIAGIVGLKLITGRRK